MLDLWVWSERAYSAATPVAPVEVTAGGVVAEGRGTLAATSDIVEIKELWHGALPSA
jgi:hypothetical protein